MFFGSRDERRWIEKQNKVMRQKRKKEEVARIRNLVGKYKNSYPAKVILWKNTLWSDLHVRRTKHVAIMRCRIFSEQSILIHKKKLGRGKVSDPTDRDQLVNASGDT